MFGLNESIRVRGQDLPDGCPIMFCPACRYVMIPRDLTHEYHCPNHECWLSHVTIWTRKSVHETTGIFPISKEELIQLTKRKK